MTLRRRESSSEPTGLRCPKIEPPNAAPPAPTATALFSGAAAPRPNPPPSASCRKAAAFSQRCDDPPTLRGGRTDPLPPSFILGCGEGGRGEAGRWQCSLKNLGTEVEKPGPRNQGVLGGCRTEGKGGQSAGTLVFF